MRLHNLPSVRTVVYATVLVVSTALPTVASGQIGSIDPLLQQRADDLSGRSRVIVEFKNSPDGRVVSERGGISGRRFANSIAADVDNTSLQLIASDPRVS